MKIFQLDERAEDNALVSRVIDHLRLKAYAHLWNNQDQELKVIDLNGRSGPCLYMREIEPGTPFDDVAVFFPYKDGYGLGGRAIWLPRPVHGINFLVELDPVDKGTRGVMKTLNVDRCANTFRHEFVHVLDMKRRKGHPALMSSTSNKAASTDPTKPTGVDPHYFNEPLELNAYYHNLAEPILTQVRYMQEHGEDGDGKEVLGLLDRLPRDFRTWMEHRVSTMDRPLRNFWGVLRKQNKRQIISRLYQQFNDYQRIWDEIEDHSA